MARLNVDEDFWRGRRVFLTGHTGFKGAWLAFWLRKMGALVTGYARAPEVQPNLHTVLNAEAGLIGDITDAARLSAEMVKAAPEIVLHLAAQAIVRTSYADPIDTFHTNVVGSVAVLEAVRRTESVKAVVMVSTDKCYENREWPWGYRENDALGGHDPYSASKGAGEIAISSMRRSFFAPYRKDGHPARIATARAGNVIGGGDWCRDRLVPDIVRGAASGEVVLRNPGAVRPWQHVLEPLAAYLGLAQCLHDGQEGVDCAFNFGPEPHEVRPVIDVATALVDKLGGRTLSLGADANQPHEAHLLKLDCALAQSRLGWRPRLGFEKTIQLTADWYRAHALREDMGALTARQIDEYRDAA